MNLLGWLFVYLLAADPTEHLSLIFLLCSFVTDAEEPLVTAVIHSFSKDYCIDIYFTVIDSWLHTLLNQLVLAASDQQLLQ